MADPIYVPPSGRWDGADGKWSSFQMSVGNPPQRFRVLPAPVDTVVSVPLAAVCQNNLFSQRKDCGDLRGVENYQGKSSPGFNATASIDNTNIVGGPYTFPPYQRYFGNQTAGGASFWNDSVSIGDAHTVPKQLVAGINAQEFLLGEMGLGRLETTLQQGMTPVLSLLSSLYDQKMIPRPGFAYTAGRSYVHPPMNGSLVLGGFDKSGLTSNYATVTISSPDTLPLRLYDLVAGPTLTSLQQRLISHEDGITAYIDSSVAQLWLPNKTCDAIAAAFNLTYYDSSNYYGVPDEGTESLSILQNATFTFTVGSVSDKTGNMVQIILPYSAFDYNLSFPIETSTVRYFPLRRALNDNQITLGRVFLQEAYIAVDWDAKQMVIGQAPGTLKHNIASLNDLLSTSRPVASPPTASPTASIAPSPPQGPQGLPRGAVAGIVVTAVVLAAIFTVVSISCWRRRHHGKNDSWMSCWHFPRPKRTSKTRPPSLSGDEEQSRGMSPYLDDSKKQGPNVSVVELVELASECHMPELDEGKEASHVHARPRVARPLLGSRESTVSELECPRSMRDISADSTLCNDRIRTPSPRRPVSPSPLHNCTFSSGLG